MQKQNKNKQCRLNKSWNNLHAIKRGANIFKKISSPISKKLKWRGICLHFNYNIVHIFAMSSLYLRSCWNRLIDLMTKSLIKSEEHTYELQPRGQLVCRRQLE